MVTQTSFVVITIYAHVLVEVEAQLFSVLPANDCEPALRAQTSLISYPLQMKRNVLVAKDHVHCLFALIAIAFFEDVGRQLRQVVVFLQLLGDN